METNNAAELRRWLAACPVIAAGAGAFGADYLPDAAGGYALDSVASPVKYRGNILGDMRPEPNQEQLYVLAARMDYGAGAAGNLDNLGALQAISAWVLAQSGAGNLPGRDDGTVTAVVPALTARPVAFGSDAARYQLQLRVCYRYEGAGA